MALVSQIAPFLCGDTGSLRDLDHLLWGVRLTVLLQMLHWKRRQFDQWTVPVPPPASAEAARTLAALAHGTPRFQA